MTNNDLAKTSDVAASSAAAAPSTGSGYDYLAFVICLLLLSVVDLNIEIDMIVISIMFLLICFVKMARVISMIYLVYFWIKVIRKMLIYSTHGSSDLALVVQRQKKKDFCRLH